MKYRYIVVIGLLQVSLAGCISDANYVEDDFGTSVRQMVDAQIYDPAAASQPDLIPPLLIDGEVVGTTVEGYRQDAKREDKAGSNIVFSID